MFYVALTQAAARRGRRGECPSPLFLKEGRRLSGPPKPAKEMDGLGEAMDLLVGRGEVECVCVRICVCVWMSVFASQSIVLHVCVCPVVCFCLSICIPVCLFARISVLICISVCLVVCFCPAFCVSVFSSMSVFGQLWVCLLTCRRIYLCVSALVYACEASGLAYEHLSCSVSYYSR